MPLTESDSQALFNACVGHGSPKKSRKVVLHDAQPDPIYWLKRKQLADSLRAAAIAKRYKNKASSLRAKFITAAPCARRYLEFFGLYCKKFAYTAEPKIIAKPTKFVYELQLGFEPFCSFTDLEEACMSLIALQNNGYPFAQMVQRNLSQP